MSLEEIWLLGILFFVVNIIGILKKILVILGGEVVIFFFVMIILVYCGISCENLRRLVKVLKMLENCVLVLLMVLDFSLLGIL